jgi:Mg-chelatase subunit ChlD
MIGMSTFRRWAFWRRVQYGVGVCATLVACVVLVYALYFRAPVSCFDGVLNGKEIGIDCGGSCVRICTNKVIPPVVMWAESFKITEGQYNAVAYIENKNSVASTPALSYTFSFFDGDTLLTERKGTTVLPPDSVYPIFEGRIVTEKPITRTEITLAAADMWLPATIGREQFRTSNLNLTGADDRPRLSTTIENTALTPAENVEVVATLFNDSGEAVTASQTFIESLNPRSTKDIVFTWPQPIAKTVRSCIIPTDVVLALDLSGSMNNDGGNPPQPITDALAAAQSFIKTLKPKDQAAIVTFASTSTVVATLRSDHAATAALLATLTIAPSEELGYTNTLSALQSAQVELQSSRHNADARRVLVLLTDGLPTQKGDSAPLIEATKNAAKTLSENGVSIYAIGLGKSVNTDFISAIASEPKNAYLAPTTADLDVIYKTITSSLCESGASRIDVIAKTPTNFTPLR